MQRIVADARQRSTGTVIPGGAGRPKFNQVEMVTTFTHKPRSTHAISS